MKRIDHRSRALTKLSGRTAIMQPKPTRLATPSSRAVGLVGRQLLAAADRRGHGAESRGATVGAGLGALIGSFAGPVGAIVGGGIGGLLGYASGAPRR
jgi:hypothetical protein